MSDDVVIPDEAGTIIPRSRQSTHGLGLALKIECRNCEHGWLSLRDAGLVCPDCGQRPSEYLRQ
jgi:hypothetical protein